MGAYSPAAVLTVSCISVITLLLMEAVLGTDLLLPSAGQVRIWSSQDASCTHTLDGPSGGIEWLSWHPRGDILVAGSEDFTAWMWNASSGAVMQVPPAPHHFLCA